MNAHFKKVVPPSFSEGLMESIENLLEYGYAVDKQPSNFCDGDSKFSLQSWGRLGFVLPPIIEKQEFFGEGRNSLQEVKLKFIYHEGNGLGFASLVVMSVTLQRRMPVDTKERPKPEHDVNGAKWFLVELKYLFSPENKKLICLSW
jgi:hypothetical protein